MNAEQLKAVSEISAIDWATLWPLILPLLSSLFQKNDQGVRQGRKGCCTAFLEEYTLSRTELGGK